MNIPNNIIEKHIESNNDKNLFTIDDYNVICKINKTENEHDILVHLHDLIECNVINSNYLNIPKIYKYYEGLYKKNKISAIIIEKINGMDLFNYITNNEIDDTMKLIITYKIILAINELHKNLISHGDIKLENIMVEHVEADNMFDKIKIWLIDFEFATISVNNARNKYGTIIYSSPELYFLNAYNTKSNDIWSLGVIIYCIYNNLLPFDISLLQNTSRDYAKFFKNLNVNYLNTPKEIIEILDKIFRCQYKRKKINYIKKKINKCIKNNFEHIIK